MGCSKLCVCFQQSEHLLQPTCYVQGLLVHNMRYLASVVSNCFTAFGELLALNKRFAELSGGVTR